MKNMVVEKRVSFFKFYSHDFQLKCLPYPTQIIEAIDSHLPKMAIRRNEKLQETMRVMMRKLFRLDYLN